MARYSVAMDMSCAALLAPALAGTTWLVVRFRVACFGPARWLLGSLGRALGARLVRRAMRCLQHAVECQAARS
jgi:hypothetical protein